jgi:hypothetical protein
MKSACLASGGNYASSMCYCTVNGAGAKEKNPKMQIGAGFSAMDGIVSRRGLPNWVVENPARVQV